MEKIDNFDFGAAKAFIKQKSERKKSNSFDLYKKAKKESEDIIAVIKNNFSVKRIYQWGSLLAPDQFDENSDIDIAIEGLESVEEFFKLYGLALDKTTFPLDLIEMEKIDKLNRRSIIQNGKLMYER
ncbi:MAG: nucleotidyltransferase domain-containing protein [Spirochaetales bacterium]|nr:nucleotidyltransferase domain-containing protein [Spirochaetales bacterium]